MLPCRSFGGQKECVELRFKAWRSFIEELFDSCATKIRTHIEKYEAFITGKVMVPPIKEEDVTGDMPLLLCAGCIFILNALVPIKFGMFQCYYTCMSKLENLICHFFLYCRLHF